MNKPQRRYDIDWLRVIATLGVFLFHCMRVFDSSDWEVKNNVTSESLIILIVFFGQWMMPIFFVISGAAIFYSLDFRSPQQFIKARVTRILIPYLLVGIFVLVPPQEYAKLISHGIVPADISLFTFYYKYVSNLTLVRHEFPWIGLPMMHLWYLFYLFLFSLSLLPVFMYLKNKHGRSLISRLAASPERTWTIYLFAVPIGALMAVLDPSTPFGNIYMFGRWTLLVYPVFLVYGFMLFADERFEVAIKRQSNIALILGVISYFPLLASFMKMMAGEGFFFGTLSYGGVMLLRAFNSWCWIIAFLGLGKKYLSFNSPVLRYGSEGSLPFYMLHQTVIVVIGFFIAEWQMAIFPKFFILATTSFITIMIIYELLIRRINFVRLFFGLNPVK